jgi:hypothetical protein
MKFLSARRERALPPAAPNPMLGGRRPPPQNLQVLEKLPERPGNTNVMEITARAIDPAASWSMIRKSGNRFSEKIMLKQRDNSRA